MVPGVDTGVGDRVGVGVMTGVGVLATVEVGAGVGVDGMGVLPLSGNSMAVR